MSLCALMFIQEKINIQCTDMFIVLSLYCCYTLHRILYIMWCVQENCCVYSLFCVHLCVLICFEARWGNYRFWFLFRWIPENVPLLSYPPKPIIIKMPYNSSSITNNSACILLYGARREFLCALCVFVRVYAKNNKMIKKLMRMGLIMKLRPNWFFAWFSCDENEDPNRVELQEEEVLNGKVTNRTDDGGWDGNIYYNFLWHTTQFTKLFRY